MGGSDGHEALHGRRVRRRRRWAALLGAAVLVGLVPMGPLAGTAAASEVLEPPVGTDDGMAALDYFRRLGGVPAVAEDPVLSGWAVEHARYTVRTGHFAHDQDVPSPWASANGLRSARAANGYASSGAGATGADAVRSWADSHGHGAWMFNPGLRTVGLGDFADPGSDTGFGYSAWLDVLTADHAPTAGVHTVPADGLTVVADPAWLPEATHHVVDACGGTAFGDAVAYVYLGATAGAPPVATVTVDGVERPACAAGDRSVGRRSFYAVPLGGPWRAGTTYRVRLDASAGTGAADLVADVTFRTAGDGADPSPRTDGASSGPVHRPGVVGPNGPLTVDADGPTFVPTTAPHPERLVAVSTHVDGGSWAVDLDGNMYVTGRASHHGGVGHLALAAPILAMTPTATGNGYWMAAADGGVFAFGDASFHGSVPGVLAEGQTLTSAITAMSVTPTGGGYLMVAADGGVFAFGDASFHGSIPGVLGPGQSLNSPINGLAITPTGNGYWMVAADGGIFGFGDATFHGGLGDTPLDNPIVGMIATPTGNGYWLVDAVGTTWGFGDATWSGS